MPVFQDITGKQFNHWKVIEYHGNGKWLCQCDCYGPDSLREVAGKTLKNDTSKSCGHDTNKSKVYIGMRFNNWVVIGKSQKSGYWVCQCQCKNKTIKKITSYDLTHNKSTNCGCIRKIAVVQRNSQNREELEGQHFGDWEVLRYIGDGHYECRCSCNKVKAVSASDLKSGASKSCGHNNGKHQISDITGQRFGELTAKKYLGHKIWQCECSCKEHTIVNVFKCNLLSGSTQSCGCKRYDRLSKDTILECIRNYEKEYNEKPFLYDIAKLLNRHEGNVRRYLKEYNLESYINTTYGSKAEREIHILISNANMHVRNIIENQELDFYIPEKKLAIEYNGSYWHSSLFKSEKYHQEKTLACAKQGIRLIHIFEYEWNNKIKQEKIINYIKKLCNDDNLIRIGAREVEVKAISSVSAKEFEDKWHLQGGVSTRFNIGAFYDNKLIGVLALDLPRFNHQYQYELVRLCWDSNYAVAGGTEKLFKHFIKTYKPENIITYTDISKFTGNVYTRLGFVPIQPKPITTPNYVWINTTDNTVLTRYQTQKHKLLEMKLGTKDQTEDEIMSNLGFLKLYDCGNLKLEWRKK